MGDKELKLHFFFKADFQNLEVKILEIMSWWWTFLEGSEHRIASHLFCGWNFEVTEDFLASFCRWKSKDEMYLLLEKVGVLRCRPENPAWKF